MSKNYKLYMHIFPNGKRYIGVTVQEPKKRWLNGEGYRNSRLIYNAINKYRWENIRHYILLTGLSKKEAEINEIEYIKKFKSNNYKHGYNIANGGNVAGTTSEATKKLLSEMRMGQNNPMYGLYGKEHPLSIKINQYNMDGIYIRTWDCSADVERELNIPKSKIIANCRGKRKSAGKFQWRYCDDNISDIEPYKRKDISGKNNPMYGIIGKNNPKSKKINQYTLKGEYIRSWDSATQVQNETGFSLKGVTACCRHEYKTSYGYIWKYAD